MQENGWTTNLTPFTPRRGRSWKHCSAGDVLGKYVGSVSATFKGSGLGLLLFGNCGTIGSVRVSLNGSNVATSTTTDDHICKDKATFKYTKGDTLKIDGIGDGIIKMCSLNLTSSKIQSIINFRFWNSLYGKYIHEIIFHIKSNNILYSFAN